MAEAAAAAVGGPTPPPIDGVLCRLDRLYPVNGLGHTPDSDSGENSGLCQMLEVSQNVRSLVDLTRGEYLDGVVDLSVKTNSPSISIRVKRRFFNDTWHFDHAERLEIVYGFDGKPDYIVKDDVHYKSNSDGAVFSYTQDPRFAATLHIYLKNDGYLWRDKSGNWQKYDSSGRLLSYGKRNDVTISCLYETGNDGRLVGIADHFENQLLWYHYDADGNISSVEDLSGRKVEYGYAAGKLSRVIDTLGNESLYEYDAEGRLTSKQDADEKTTTINYNKFGYVTSVTGEDGWGIFFDYVYDTWRKEYYTQIKFDNGRVKESWFDRYGNKLRTDINGRSDYSAVLSGRTKIVEDANGNKTCREYDEWGNLIKLTYMDKTTIEYEYDPTFFNVTKKIDERGIVTEYEYDNVGNMVKMTEAKNTLIERVTEYTYDSHGNQLTLRMQGDENTEETLTTMTYDDHGNMTSLADPEGQTTLFTHDIMGNVLTRQDALEKVWSFKYDNTGRLISSTDPLSNLTSMFYNGVGNFIKEVDADGNVKTYKYDQGNNMECRTDALGNSTLYEYNTDGKPTRISDPEGKEVQYDYDADGRLTKIIDGNGNETLMVYENETSGCAICSGGMTGDPAKIIYPTFAKEYKYDSRGRKVEERDVLSDDEAYLTQFGYDASGNLTSRTDKEGEITIYEYDALDRLVKVVDPLVHETAYSYDDRDNLIVLTDSNGNVTLFQYDRNNRLIKEIRPLSQETLYVYDGVVNLIQKFDAKGQKTEYEYDAAGRQTKISYFSATDPETPAKNVTFTYDKFGNIKSYDDGITSAQYVYDDVYRKLSETVNYGSFELTYSYTYYGNGKKKSFTGPDGITYAYTYDNNNKLASVLIPGQGYISYNSYKWNKPVSITLPGGTKKEYAYDPLMRIKKIVAKDPGQNELLNYQYSYDKMDNITARQTEHGNYAYGYDDLYRLATADNPDFTDETFTYDAVGNRLTSADTTANWSYNQNNELGGYDNISCVYDNNGNMVQKTVGDVVTNHIYNVENRLTEVRDGLGSLIALYYYDPFGKRLWKEVGEARTYFLYTNEGLIGEYDSSGQETKSYGYKPGSMWTTDPLFMKQGANYYFYHNDHLGSPQKMTAVNGAVVWSAKYTSFGKAEIDANSTITNNLRFPGQYFDGESGLHLNWFRYYDSQTGRYLRTDPVGIPLQDLNTYIYVSNAPNGKYDPFGLFEHRQGGPWHPPDGISVGCTSLDDCSVLSKKMSLLKKMINSHIQWDQEHAIDRHANDIQELQNAYNNCLAIHQRKCVDQPPECSQPQECEEDCKKTVMVVATTVVVGGAVYVVYYVVKICIFTTVGGPLGFFAAFGTP